MYHALEAMLVVMDELAHDEARLAHCHPTGGADGAAGRKHVLHERLTVLVQNEIGRASCRERVCLGV